MIFKCRKVSKGKAKGWALTSTEPLSFLGGVDPLTGTVVEKGHPLEGEFIAGKVLIIPKGKGSTVGTYVIYQLKKGGRAPAAIIALKADNMVASGAIISEIPMVHRPDGDVMTDIPTGSFVEVNADEGYVKVDL